MADDLSLADVLAEYADTAADHVHTGIPARVLSYSASAQTVDVEIAICPEGQTPVTLASVPVLWPGGGGFVVTFPITAGDHVYLLFAQDAIGQWRATGERSAPNEDRRHSVGYPVAIPRIRPDTSPLATASSTEARIGSDSGPARIDFTVSTIKLGVGATQPVALAPPVAAILAIMATAFAKLATSAAIAPDVATAAACTAVAGAMTTNVPLIPTTAVVAK